MAEIFEIGKAEQRYREVFEPVVKAEGLEIYDLEYIQGQFLVRLYIRNPESLSATIDECAKVDRALSPVVEAEEWMPEKIVLEVSSPGMTRKLKSIKHFEEAIGENILVQLVKKLTDENRELPKKIKGQNKFAMSLKEVTDSGVLGLVENIELEISFENIKKATIEPDWDKMMASEKAGEESALS